MYGDNTVFVKLYSLHVDKRSLLGQGHGLQNITLTLCYYKNIYIKVRYVYFYENIFQDKSIHIIFTFANSTILKLLMIYIPNVWPKPCPNDFFYQYGGSIIYSWIISLHVLSRRLSTAASIGGMKLTWPSPDKPS